MPADVNVTEKVARALNPSAFDPKAWPPVTFGQSVDEARAEWRQEAFEEAQRALSVLADPAVLAVIAGVLDEHDMGRLTSGRPYCWTHHTHDPLHLAAAVVEWLRGRAL